MSTTQSKNSSHITALSEDNSLRSENVYVSPGYVKIDGIRYLNDGQILDFLTKIKESVATTLNDSSYNNSQFIIKNVVTSHKTIKVFGFAWVRVIEDVPGNRLYNILIGKKVNGDNYTEGEARLIKINPLIMTRNQVQAYWLSIQREYSQGEYNVDKKSIDYQVMARSYEDYEILRQLLLPSSVGDIDANMNILNKYNKFLEERIAKNVASDNEKTVSQDITNEDIDFNELLSTVKKQLIVTIRSISVCMVEVNPAFVSDSKNGNSYYHLVTRDLEFPDITVDVLRKYFSPFNSSVDGIYTDTYEPMNKTVTGPYPHIWIQQFEGKLIGHIAFNKSMDNYDARYAIYFVRQFEIDFFNKKTKEMTKKSTAVSFYNETFFKERTPNQKFSQRPPYIRNSVKSVNNPAVKNIFDNLAGKDSNKEAWSGPLPQNIKEGNEYTTTITLSNERVFTRKYDPNLRDDGNLTQFF